MIQNKFREPVLALNDVRFLQMSLTLAHVRLAVIQHAVAVRVKHLVILLDMTDVIRIKVLPLARMVLLLIR